MTNSTALSGGNVTSLRKEGHTVDSYLYPIPLSNVATARINQASFDKPLASLTVDGTSGWSNVKPGMVYWIGTTAGARDVHVGRVRGSDATHLFTEEFSDGDPGKLPLSTLASLADSLYITIKKWYDGLDSVFPRIVYSGGVDARVGAFYKNYDAAYSTQNETAPPGIVRIGQHRISDTSPAEFAFTAFAENWNIGTVDTYAWDVDGGNITAGADDEQSVTVEWTTGVYWISCTVTFDTGASTTARRVVLVDQDAIPITRITSDTRDIHGRRMSFSTPESLLTVPDGVMCIYHETASWGGDSIAEATTQFVGFVRSIEHAQTDGIQRHNFEMVSPLLAARDLVAFSQELTMASDPENWQEAIHALMHLDFWVFYLLYWHSTLPTLFDIEISGLSNHLTQAWAVQAGSLFGALENAGERLNCSVGQDSRGTIFIKRDPQFMTNADRDGVIERMTLTEADFKLDTLNWGNNPVRTLVGRVEGSGFSFDGGSLTPVLSQAPGFVGGQGAAVAQLQDQLLYAFDDPQSELNQRTACMLAKENNPYGDISGTLIANYDVFEPSERYWIRLNIGASSGPNGAAFNKRVLLHTVSKRHLGGGAAEIDVNFEAEVYADAAQGQTIPIIPDATYNAGVVDGTSFYNMPTFNPDGTLVLSYDPFTVPNVSYPPAVTPPTEATATGYVLTWTANILYNSSNYGTTWGTLYNATDDIVNVAYDPNSPVTTALKLWVLTDAGLEYNDDALGVGSWDAKQSFTGGQLLRALAGVTGGIAVYVVDSGDVKIIYSDDTGDTITTTTVAAEAGDSGFDGDDYGEGILVVAADNGIWFSTDYDGAFTELTGLDGVDGSTPIVTVRVPLKKLLTQEDNDDPEALQFLYGTQSAVDGATLWAVTFDTTDGTVINQTDITPILSSVTSTETIDFESALPDWITTVHGTVTTPGNPGNALIKAMSTGNIPGDIHAVELELALVGGLVLTRVAADMYSDTAGTTVQRNHRIQHSPDGTTFTDAVVQLGNDATWRFIEGDIPNLEGTVYIRFQIGTSAGASSEVRVDNIVLTFEATAYAAVGANALETAGANTQVILMAAQPVGGGTKKLLRTIGGGSAWNIIQNIDLDFVRWAPGSQQRVWLSGADGIRYSTNRANTVQNKTSGTTGDVLGVQGF